MPNISRATEYNWRRLNSSAAGKLKARANKTASTRRITATSYLNSPKANQLLLAVENVNAPIPDIMYSLCHKALQEAGIADCPHVMSFLNGYREHSLLPVPFPDGCFEPDTDTLGFIYQSLTSEGSRNRTGLYYTSSEIVSHLIKTVNPAPDETILDPCCGSGAFLLQCRTEHPENLHGYDNDPITVMIASVNLLLKYRHIAFTPNIQYRDFLDYGLFTDIDQPDGFDYIFTNPPWGTDRTALYAGFYPAVKSNERASMVVTAALGTLKPHGRAIFVLPVSLLKTSIHADIRKYLLRNFRILRIDLFNKRFDGVYTNFFAIEIENSRPNTGEQTYQVTDAANTSEWITLSEADITAGNIRMSVESDLARSIMQKVDARCRTTLSGCRFALGIVTGDNKNKLLAAPAPGAEPIYTGKEIAPMRLTAPNKYIIYNRADFQQCAPDECYRAPEKLIYRFIARYPIVSYDTSGALCLNSANIIIPDIDGISAKCIAALLNSALYRFYYTSKFHDIKVLKGNLQKLPIPQLTANEDNILSALADSNDSIAINDFIFNLFGISQSEQTYIADHADID